MNLRDCKNLESAQKRCEIAAKESSRAANVLAGVIKRANDAAKREEQRKAKAAQEKAQEWQRKHDSGAKRSGRRLSRGG